MVSPVTKAAKVSDASRPMDEVKPEIANRIGGNRHHRVIGTVIGRATPIAMQAQIGNLAAAGVHGDAHMAHFTAGDFPREAQTVSKSILHPIGGKFRGQVQFERAGFLTQPAHLNRLDPLAVELMTQILAQPLADVGPIRRQVYCFKIFHRFVFFPFCAVEVDRLAHRVFPTPKTCGNPQQAQLAEAKLFTSR